MTSVEKNNYRHYKQCLFDCNFFHSSCSAAMLFAVYVLCMFALYSFMPVVVKMTSATAVNLSLLTADLFSLFCGIFLFKYMVSSSWCLNLLLPWKLQMLRNVRYRGNAFKTILEIRSLKKKNMFLFSFSFSAAGSDISDS